MRQLSTTLSSDSSSVIPGGTLHLHGSNFLPGSNIALTLDNGLPVSFIDTNASGEVQHQTRSTALQMINTEQTIASNSAIALSSTGTFDVDMKVSATLSLGRHTIHATGGIISRSAELNFTVVKPTLVVQTSTLDFGKPEKGIKPILPVEIDDTGTQSLNWTADTGSAGWLKLSSGSGRIGPRGFQVINVTADTSQLEVKAYIATIAINSSGGNGGVEVRISVQPPNSHKQAVLNVNPSSLDFGTLGASTQSSLAVLIGNVGNQALNWKANIASASWLLMDNSFGTIQPGGLPQQVQVTANTSQLATGSYSISLSIDSNGGKTVVHITLTVNTSATASTGIPTLPTSPTTPSQPGITPTAPPPGITPTIPPPGITPTSPPPGVTPTTPPPPPPPFTQTGAVNLSPDSANYGYTINSWSKPAYNTYCQLATCDPSSQRLTLWHEGDQVTAVCWTYGQRVITGTLSNPGYDDNRWVRLTDGSYLPNTWFVRTGLSSQLPPC